MSFEIIHFIKPDGTRYFKLFGDCLRDLSIGSELIYKNPFWLAGIDRRLIKNGGIGEQTVLPEITPGDHLGPFDLIEIIVALTVPQFGIIIERCSLRILLEKLSSDFVDRVLKMGRVGTGVNVDHVSVGISPRIVQIACRKTGNVSLCCKYIILS